jgi:hypothetical protein
MNAIESRLEKRWGSAIRPLVPQLERARFLSEAMSLNVNVMPIKQLVQLTPAKRAKMAKNIAAKASSLMLAIKNCDEVLKRCDEDVGYITAAFREELARIKELDRGLPSRFPRRAGGQKADRLLKLMASRRTAQMLTDLGVELVTSRDKPWVKLTAQLFYVATGNACKDAQAVCLKHKRRSG